jgi:hypothetical protein
MWRVSRAGSSPAGGGSGGAVGRRRGRRLVRSVPRTAWLVGRGSGVAGCLGRGRPTRPPGARVAHPASPGGGAAHPAPVGLVARVCRLCGGFLVPAALRGRGSGGAVGRRRGRRLRSWRRDGLGLYGGGAGSTTATSHERVRRSGIATLPAYIDGNVAPDVRAGDSCDVTVVGAGTTGHTLPPYPAHAVTAPRREPTPSAPADSSARATSHHPPSGTASATLPFYFTGNVTQPGAHHRECDVAVLSHGQRRIHRARAGSVRRYRRRRR